MPSLRPTYLLCNSLFPFFGIDLPQRGFLPGDVSDALESIPHRDLETDADIEAPAVSYIQGGGRLGVEYKRGQNLSFGQADIIGLDLFMQFLGLEFVREVLGLSRVAVAGSKLPST